VDQAKFAEAVKATITMESGGIIVLELYPKIAPQSVYNFVYLARRGFYNGLIFHRVIEGFMIQGGDPDGVGTGGPGYSIKGEFAINGFDNPLAHERGVISMARSSAYDSAGSQFFIVHQDASFLNGSYAAFGQVISGMETVDEIAKSPTGRNDRPVSEIKIKSITIDGPQLPEPERLEK
jgi:peptidyl-prolyl cis-trans isomerase B (cyclophilin B)